MTRWLGVDVGGARKRFDVALVDERRLLALEGGLSRDAVVALVRRTRPAVVAIDGPRRCAPDGETSRASERQLARAVCGIRWTPDAATVHDGSAYYGWVVEGLALYEALAAEAVEVIEVFPTASWTRWHGPRGSATRAAWSGRALAALDLEGVPPRLGQDARDAIAAALTAREHARGTAEAIGEIVVPRATGAAGARRCGGRRG